MNAVSPLPDAEALYRGVAAGGAQAGLASAQLALRSWLSQLTELDARTGQPLPQAWSALCRRTAHTPDPLASPMDQVGAIIAHVGGALRHLMAQPRQRIVRGHAMLPLHAARELDSVSIAWLGRQTGRSVREKLAGKPGMLAVQRLSSPDTLENRLMRAFCKRLERLLSMRCTAFPGNPAEDELLDDLRHWLRDGAGAIGDWGHLPPNNVLLQDRHYRKVWDGWMRLQHLDEQVLRDSVELEANWMTVLRWKLAGCLHMSGQVCFPEQPCYVGAEFFTIEAERGQVMAGLLVDGQDIGMIEHLGEGDKGGYGFIRTSAGRLYFHHRSLARPDQYTQLRRGMRVRFAMRPDGKAAASVAVLDEPRDGARVLALRPGAQSGFEVVLDDQSIQVRLAAAKHGKLTVMLGSEAVGIGACTLTEVDRIAERLLARLKLSVAAPARSIAAADPGSPAVVDLAILRPAYAMGAQAGELPFRLMRQYWATEHGEVALDLGDATAVTLAAHVPVLSMTDIIQGRDTAGATRRDEAAIAFAARLAGFFGDVPLTYLTPDSIDDFALGTARRGLNSCFTRADPLPRSVAALFDWLRHRNDADRIRPGDYVLVLDNVGDNVTLTPLQAHAAPTLEQQIPELQGLAWEKLPVLEGATDSSLEALASTILRRQRCAAVDELGAWMAGQEADGKQGLAWDIAPSGWFSMRHQTPPLPEAAVQDVQDLLKRARSGFRRGNRCVAVVLACGTDHLMRPLADALAKSEPAAWPAVSLVEGARQLLDWQRRASPEALWYERLPDLSIRIPADGRYRRFHLVHDHRIEPRPGIAHIIPVDEVFTLPAGQRVLQLPLRQGSAADSGKVLSYRLRIASPAFPLAEDVPARLQLSFSYGSDDPYALSFIACDPGKAGFASVRATWVAADVHELATHVPASPPLRAWADLERQWKSSNLDVLDKRLSALYYKFQGVGSRGYQKSAVRELVQEMRRDLRWLMLDIWSDRRSIADADCPDPFRHAMRCSLPVLVPINDEIWRESAARPELRDLGAEFMFLMCSLRADMPREADATVRQQVLHSLKDRQFLERTRLSLACLLGHSEKHKVLLPELMNVLQNGEPATQAIVVSLLGVALWRSPELLEAFDLGQLRLTVAALGKRLTSVSHKIGLSESVSRELGDELRDCLELLLALLRTRASTRPAIARLLAVGSPAVSELAGVLERIEPHVCQPETRLRPRIAFESSKPASLEATPDLLYLANLYLLGESGIGQIRITGMIDED